jgi:uncharacterized protein YdeI (YjbR/CyaY-like superfamily)
MPAPLPENAIQPATRAAWRRWLERHHARPLGVWFVYYKKRSGKARYGYEDMIEEALCFGWIDGVARAFDDERAMLWLSPRKPRSVWSAINKARVERILAAGLMHPAGLAKIEAAKQNGSWNALDTIDRLEIPPDLAGAFVARPGAAANFDAYPRSMKRGVLEWIRQAKRSETRARRIAAAAQMAAENRRFAPSVTAATRSGRRPSATPAARTGTRKTSRR